MMKALILSALTFSLLVAISTFAVSQDGNPDPVKAEEPNIELRSKVVKMIRYANLTGIPEHHRDATVDFLVTNDNQLLVLNVETYSPYLKSFIKDRLNYKHLNVNGVKKLTTYSLDVTFVAKS